MERTKEVAGFMLSPRTSGGFAIVDLNEKGGRRGCFCRKGGNQLSQGGEKGANAGRETAGMLGQGGSEDSKNSVEK